MLTLKTYNKLELNFSKRLVADVYDEHIQKFVFCHIKCPHDYVGMYIEKKAQINFQNKEVIKVILFFVSVLFCFFPKRY